MGVSQHPDLALPPWALPQASQRPAPDLIGRRQREQEVRQIVGQRVKLYVLFYDK